MSIGNLATRSITGILFVTVIIGSIYYGPFSQIVVFSLFMISGLIEFFRLFNFHPLVKISKEIGIFIGIFIFSLLVGISLEILPVISVTILFPLFFSLILFELWKKNDNPIINISVLVFGIIYIAIPFYLTIDLNLRDEAYLPLIVGMFLLIWTNDCFAYFTGRLFGKRKLFERISPNKTWEGAIGGILFTLIVGYIIGAFINKGEEFFWVMSALIIAPCSIYGDLLESLFKRSLNIKDSGTILPGHGGILDRFDAALFTIPFFYAWAMLYLFW